MITKLIVFLAYRQNFLNDVSQLLGLLEKLVIRNAPYKSDAHILFPGWSLPATRGNEMQGIRSLAPPSCWNLLLIAGPLCLLLLDSIPDLFELLAVVLILKHECLAALDVEVQSTILVFHLFYLFVSCFLELPRLFNSFLN